MLLLNQVFPTFIEYIKKKKILVEFEAFWEEHEEHGSADHKRSTRKIFRG